MMHGSAMLVLTEEIRCRRRSNTQSGRVLQSAQNRLAHLPQNFFVASGSVGHHVMQRLVHAPDAVRSQPGRHRVHALTLAWNQQTGAVVLQRNRAIGMSRGFPQAIHIGRKAFLLWAWRGGCSRKDIYTRLFVYKIVVFTRWDLTPPSERTEFFFGLDIRNIY
jgi:hypothetical protein